MAEKPDRRSYPKIPDKNWWALRHKFQQSLPKEVNADYLQSVLGHGSPRGAANLLAPLRTLGLIDKDGHLQERVNDWRHNDSYKQACNAMLEETYPDGLRAAFPDPTSDDESLISWFSRNTESGRSNAKQMASLYTLISAGDPDMTSASMAVSSKSERKPGTKTAVSKSSRQATVTKKPSASVENHRRIEPELNINVQIHISSDASAEQIDQIFSSMATHLYSGPRSSDE